MSFSPRFVRLSAVAPPLNRSWIGTGRRRCAGCLPRRARVSARAFGRQVLIDANEQSDHDTVPKIHSEGTVLSARIRGNQFGARGCSTVRQTLTHVLVSESRGAAESAGGRGHVLAGIGSDVREDVPGLYRKQCWRRSRMVFGEMDAARVSRSVRCKGARP